MASCSPSADMASLFDLPTIDIADRIEAMLEVERRPHHRPRDYLRRRHRSDNSSRRSRSSSRRRREAEITPSSRAKIVRWLYDCVDYLELPRECVAEAMSCLDRFMSNNNSSNRKVVAKAQRDATMYQLVAVAALFVAAKQSSNSAGLDAEVLARVSHGSYSAQEILDMEATLLDALEWRVCGPTAMGTANHLVALLSKQRRRGDDIDSADRERRTASAVDFARLQIELSVSDYRASVLRRPSEVALAAVLNAVDLLDYSSRERRSFVRSLKEKTGLDAQSDKIEEVREELQEVFDHQSDDVVGRASAASLTAEKSVSTSKTSRTPAGASYVTPRSSTSSRRRKGRRERTPRPSPMGVEARLEKLRIEP